MPAVSQYALAGQVTVVVVVVLVCTVQAPAEIANPFMHTVQVVASHVSQNLSVHLMHFPSANL